MKLNLWPAVAFTLLTGITSNSNAGLFDFLGDITNAGCTWNFNDPEDMAVSQYERLTTPLPPGLNRKVVPFKESDLKNKSWIAAYEYVVVVNNSSPYQHYTELPNKMPFLDKPLSAYGVEDSTRGTGVTSSENKEAAQAFLQTYGAEADKIRKFGEVIYSRQGRGQMVPLRNESAVDAQTVRIYQRGQLIRMAKISTGRGSFQLRGRKSYCEQPLESYHTFTEPGYYNFQELLKEYKSKSYDADMPFAMFYNRGRGLALHEVFLPEKIAHLGTRASGGCTRMDPATAADLFERIASTEGATIPQIDVLGNPVRDARGQQVYKSSETIVYGEGTNREQRTSHKSFNALLIIQPEAVSDANLTQDRAVQFIYRNR